MHKKQVEEILYMKTVDTFALFITKFCTLSVLTLLTLWELDVSR